MAGVLWLAAVVGAAAVAVVDAAAAAATATAVGVVVVAAMGEAAVMVVGAMAVAIGSGPRLDSPVEEGEEWRTRGHKLCPPRVLTMLGSEKGRRWREWEEEDLK